MIRSFTRPLIAVLLTLLSVIILFSAGLGYLIVTPLGGKLLLRYFKQEFYSVGLINIGHYEGTLQNGFILKDVSITGLSYFPNAHLRIQEIDVRLSMWDLPHYDINIFNARVLLPDSDAIVFTGRVYAGQIKGDLYANSVDIHEACHTWAIDDLKKNLKGFASNVDMKIEGALNSPSITGHFLADNIRYKSIFLTDGFSRINWTLKYDHGQTSVNGLIILDSAQIKVRKTDLDVYTSKFNFQGDILNPILDIHLGSRLEDTDINLTIKGALSNPQLTVTSDPPMSPQDALQMLFTGNAWTTPTSPFNGVTSGELAQNFLNYSLNDINDQQQFGLKTKLTDNLKLGVEVDQLPGPPGETNVYYSRKINGEMDLSDHTSLNISREILSQPGSSADAARDSQSASETQIYVQYKKRF